MKLENIHKVYRVECNLCTYCTTTRGLTLCNVFHGAPCILYKWLIAVQSSAKNLYNTTLAKKAPISAIRTLRGKLGNLRFVAVYEDEASRKEFGAKIRIAFEDNGILKKCGKLWISHSVVKEILAESSFKDWILWRQP